MDKKEIFVSVEIEVVALNDADVITTSGPDPFGVDDPLY